MRSTTVRTNSNIDIVVPNQSFVENNIINWTHHDNEVRLKIPFSVAYGVEFEKVEEVILEALSDSKLDYINDSKEKDKFLEFKLATIFRDKIEKTIPTTSTIDKKSSNLFGSINNNLFENVNLSYDFSIDNDYKTFESHSLNSEITINNFITEFNFIEQRNELGSNHVLTNTTSYNLDKNNSLSFSTRRNKEISLTEYYDFSYEYKNDCLTAAIKYNKTFYQDNDLKPEENLFFTISLIPLTTYERRIYER